MVDPIATRRFLSLFFHVLFSVITTYLFQKNLLVTVHHIKSWIHKPLGRFSRVFYYHYIWGAPPMVYSSRVGHHKDG